MAGGQRLGTTGRRDYGTTALGWSSPCPLVLLSLALSLLICGCREETSSSAPSSPVLVTVNGRAITQSDFDSEAERRPNLSAEAVLSNLVERQVMLIRAEASGVADRPAFKRDMENKLISEWLATARDGDAAADITEDELKAAYEARQGQMFTRPPLTRYAILYRKGRDIEELKGALAEAVARFRADRDAATNNGRLQGFGKIAADHSEDTVSRYKGGDIGWVGDDTASRVPAEVLAAGKALEVGAAAGPVVADGGVYVIMKTDERAVTQIDFKEAAPALRRRLIAEKKAEADARFRAGLMEGVAVVRKASPAAPGKPPDRNPSEDAPPAFPLSTK
ncbi:MAG: peptidyl-prolyl cis-trans isomerase [Kiritimatiellaeota bacterium]|nr:peptidyl-prolyl cis-trans isomerase [Kiritimatiellota bacterium]